MLVKHRSEEEIRRALTSAKEALCTLWVEDGSAGRTCIHAHRNPTSEVPHCTLLLEFQFEAL